MNFNQKLENLLKQNSDFCDKEGKLLKLNIKNAAIKFDRELILLLLSDIKIKEHFFETIGEANVFNYRKFLDYIEDKNFLLDSYTKFSNKIGLTISNKHIKQNDDVLLSFPFKDCVLEGGQSKDEEKRKEIFFNEVLAKDEITTLFDNKIIEKPMRCTYDEENIKSSTNVSFEKNEEGDIIDNLLIKGNNLVALHSLKSKFLNKIKMIYIDPPYYFQDKKDVDSFNYNSNFKLSSWLVFMKNRLEIAKELLADDGVIFVQVGEESQAYLEVMMNEIFPNNRLGVVSRVQKKGSDLGTYFSPTLDYILAYAKDKSSLKPFKDSIDQSKFKKVEDSGERKGELYEDSKSLYQSSLSDLRKGQKYLIECPDGSKVIPPCFKIDEVQTKGEKRWRWSKERYLKDKHLLVFKKTKSSPLLDENLKPSKWNVYTKRYLKDAQEKGNVPSNLFENFLNSSATKDLSKLGIDFSFSKPKELIEYLIDIVQLKDGDIVLDFFGGSGTTAHAVLNKDINLQFILIEQMDYITGITRERIKQVVDSNKKGSFVYFELAKYNQEFIDELSVATDVNIMKIYEDIKSKSFLNYDIDLNKIEENFDLFKALTLEEKKEFLLSMLNKNQLYKNLSDMQDASFDISPETKLLNKEFYNLTDSE